MKMLSLKMECFATLVIEINTAPSTISRTLHRFLDETVIIPVEMKKVVFGNLGIHCLPLCQIQECVRQIKSHQNANHVPFCHVCTIIICNSPIL